MSGHVTYHLSQVNIILGPMAMAVSLDYEKEEKKIIGIASVNPKPASDSRL